MKRYKEILRVWKNVDKYPDIALTRSKEAYVYNFQL